MLKVHWNDLDKMEQSAKKNEKLPIYIETHLFCSSPGYTLLVFDSAKTTTTDNNKNDYEHLIGTKYSDDRQNWNIHACVGVDIVRSSKISNQLTNVTKRCHQTDNMQRWDISRDQCHHGKCWRICLVWYIGIPMELSHTLYVDGRGHVVFVCTAYECAQSHIFRIHYIFIKYEICVKEFR